MHLSGQALYLIFMTINLTWRHIIQQPDRRQPGGNHPGSS